MKKKRPINVKLLTLKSLPPDEYMVVYSQQRNKLGLLANNIVSFGLEVNPLFEMEEYDLFTICDLKEFFDLISQWTTLVAIGSVRLISADAYAVRYKLKPWKIKKLANTALGQALGCRHLRLNGETWVSIPENLDPKLWAGLYDQTDDLHEEHKKIVSRFLKDGQWRRVREFMDKHAKGGRIKWYERLKKMRKEGFIEHISDRSRSMIRLPPKSLENTMGDKDLFLKHVLDKHK